MEGIIIIIWIGISILVATLGEETKIGFGTTLLVSIILSPLIGLVIALASEKSQKTAINLAPFWPSFWRKNEA